MSRWEIRHILPPSNPPHSLFPNDMPLLLKLNGVSCGTSHPVSPLHFFLFLILLLQQSTSRDNSHFPEIYDLLDLFCVNGFLFVKTLQGIKGLLSFSRNGDFEMCNKLTCQSFSLLCTCHCCLNHGRSCGNSHSSLLSIFMLFHFIAKIDF